MVGAFSAKKTRQAPFGYGKPIAMVMLRENQLCLEPGWTLSRRW